jgi:hypothetical protein
MYVYVAYRNINILKGVFYVCGNLCIVFIYDL